MRRRPSAQLPYPGPAEPRTGQKCRAEGGTGSGGCASTGPGRGAPSASCDSAGCVRTWTRCRPRAGVRPTRGLAPGTSAGASGPGAGGAGAAVAARPHTCNRSRPRQVGRHFAARRPHCTARPRTTLWPQWTAAPTAAARDVRRVAHGVGLPGARTRQTHAACDQQRDVLGGGIGRWASGWHVDTSRRSRADRAVRPAGGFCPGASGCRGDRRRAVPQSRPDARLNVLTPKMVATSPRPAQNGHDKREGLTPASRERRHRRPAQRPTSQDPRIHDIFSQAQRGVAVTT